MSEEKISLINCDFTKKKCRLNSPHSLLACRLIGVTQEDLIYQTLDEYVKNNIDCQYLEKELQQERYNHFEKNRKELIESVKNQREFLIKEEESKKNNNNVNYNTTNTNNYNSSGTLGNTNTHTHSRTYKKNQSYGTLDTYGESSTAIKLERERLRKLKEKQELSVRLQIDYECMREENRRKNLEKMRKKEEKGEQKRIEKEKELMEKKKKEREKELEKKRKEEEKMKE